MCLVCVNHEMLPRYFLKKFLFVINAATSLVWKAVCANLMKIQAEREGIDSESHAVQTNA